MIQTIIINIIDITNIIIQIMTTTMDNVEINNPKIQEVVAIVDRSGSMMGKEKDTVGGINSTFKVLKDENKNNEIIKVSVKLFDHEEIMLFKSIDLKDVKPITNSQFVPRGQTALLDAIGNTLNHFMEKKLFNSNAYDSCVIYIATDGEENSSKHFSAKKIKNMIEEAENNFNIRVLYLAANQDAILEASKYGINPNQALNYSETGENVDAAFRSAASVARRFSQDGSSQFTHIERTMSQPVGESYSSSPPNLMRQTMRHEPPRINRQRRHFSHTS